jgi:hypothetical protein
LPAEVSPENVHEYLALLSYVLAATSISGSEPEFSPNRLGEPVSAMH